MGCGQQGGGTPSGAPSVPAPSVATPTPYAPPRLSKGVQPGTSSTPAQLGATAAPTAYVPQGISKPFNWSGIEGGKGEGPPNLDGLKAALFPTPVPVATSGSPGTSKSPSSTDSKSFFEKLPLLGDSISMVKDAGTLVLTILPIFLLLMVIGFMWKIISWLFGLLFSPWNIFKVFGGDKPRPRRQKKEEED